MFIFLKEYVVSDEHEKNNKKHISYKLNSDRVENAEEELEILGIERNCARSGNIC